MLTGGACASLHSGGVVQSYDLDFIVITAITAQSLDRVMATIGFRREGRHYRHSSSKFFVEFPSGPLGIGRDIGVRPITRKIGRASLAMLSPTDSCRDRLAAFYHWRDRQSLIAAVEIACRNRINMKRVREWSASEGTRDGFKEFVRELQRRGRRGT